MDLLEAYDLTGSYRAAARLAGCDHHTVARHVRLRDAGLAPMVGRRSRLIDPFLPKVQEMVERSSGLVRAGVVHERIVAMGFEGAERTTRRAVAEAKREYRMGRRAATRAWIPEPGLWAQWVLVPGPVVAGRCSALWSCWLPWSRYTVVLPILDRSRRTLAICLDVTVRRFGGVPTYLFLEAGSPAFPRAAAGQAGGAGVAADMTVSARHFGMTARTCRRASSAVWLYGDDGVAQIADADAVPVPCLPVRGHAGFHDLEMVCRRYSIHINERGAVGERPVDMLSEERRCLHPLPAATHRQVQRAMAAQQAMPAR